MKYAIAIECGGTWYLDKEKQMQFGDKKAARFKSRQAAEEFRQKWAGNNEVCLRRSSVVEVA